MVMSMRKMAAFIAISLVTVVISLTTNAGAAGVPTVTVRPTWVPVPGFGAVIGKVATDATGNMYVADTTQKAIVKLSPAGSYLGKISTASVGAPYGVAVLKNENIVVTTQIPVPRIAMFDKGGTLVSAGTDLAAAQLQKPSAVVVDGLDNIYVLDSGTLTGTYYYNPATFDETLTSGSYPSIHVFTKNGAKYLTTPYIGARPAGYADNSFGTIGRLAPYRTTDDKGFGILGPEGLFFDKNNKRILVADTVNGRVVAFGSVESATPFVQLAKPGQPTVPLQWGTQYLADDKLASGTPHMAAPSGVTVEFAGTGNNRIYVLDRVMHRVLVLDYDSGALVKYNIDAANYPSLSLVYPRDIHFSKGNLLITSEKAKNPAHIETLGIDTAAWPPSTLEITLDAYAPNISKQTNDVYRFTGKVETGSSVSWTNAHGALSNSCNIPNPVGSGLESFYCDVTMDVVGGAAGTQQSVVVTATKSGNTNTADASPWYTTLSGLNAAPAVSSVAPASLFAKTTPLTLTGTINFGSGVSTAGATVQVKNLSNSQSVYATINLAAAGDVKPWTADVHLDEGVNTFAITGWGQNTQIGTAASQSVTLDTTPPSISLGFLSDGATTTSQVLNLNGLLADANIDSVKVLVNGEVHQDAVKYDAANKYFSTVVELPNNGLNTVLVRATDKAGNIGEQSRTVTLAPMKAQPFTVASQTVFLSATPTSFGFSGTMDSSTSSVKVALDDYASLAGSTWSHSSTRYIGKDGELEEVPIVATGTYGTLNQVRSILLDSHTPELIIATPGQDVAVKSTVPVAFSGTFNVSANSPGSPVNSVTAELFDASGNTVAGVVAITPDYPNKQFSGTVNLSGKPEGKYMLKVTAMNGNSEFIIATRNLLLDTTAPKVGICAGSATMVGAVESGSRVQNNAGRAMTLNGNIWSMDANGLDLGTLTINAVDPAGNLSANKAVVVNVPDGDMDGDGVVRVYDAIVALRAVTNGASSAQLLHGDVSVQGYTTAGLSCPDGDLTTEDVQLILAKASGKAWQ